MFIRNWQPTDCYLQEDGDTIRIGNGQIERILSRRDGILRTIAAVNKETGRRWTIDTRAEARLRFSSARARFDVVQWQYASGTAELVAPSDDAGFREGYHLTEFDDHDWAPVECLTAVGEGLWERVEPVWPGYGWFRTTFPLPPNGGGETVYFGLGGYDQEDWQFYRVFVNGIEIGRRESTGRWREPRPFAVGPDHPAYSSLRFGADNVLAVQTGRLDKRLPGMIPAEMEHYLFRSRLVDQFVTVGPPIAEVSQFRLKDWAKGGDRDWLWTTFWAQDPENEVEVVYHYQVRSGEPLVRKKIEVRNLSDAPRILLDLDVEDFEIDGTTSAGGAGLPVLLDDEAFWAIEHPAGVNQGRGNAIRLGHHPGVSLTPGQSTMSKVAIFGATAAKSAREGFQTYLRKAGRRKDQWTSIYDPLGLVDYCNPKDPLFHVTEQITLDTATMLETLRDRGVTFDYYIIDVGWQDHFSDLTSFKSDNFPDGPGRLVRRLDDLGIRFGLWFATTMANWSCGNYPPVQRCLIPNSLGGPRRGRELCIAAEPYRGIFRNAVLHHIRNNEVRAVKFDTARFYCNSTDHGHLPGKYSVEAQIDAMVETASRATRECPDLFVIWYWGYSSPFWLLHGDTMFDKSLRMEAAAVASSPDPSFRSSVSLNLDQAARYAEFVPLIAQDSLGVWIGDVIWANRMGKDDWRDAWLLDLARGNLVSQLWGNLAMFDDSDVAFLAEWHAFLRENWPLYRRTRPILGDPWKAEVYGYASGEGAHSIITVHNAGFRAAPLTVHLDERVGLEKRNGTFQVRKLYPDRGVLSPSQRSGFGHGDGLDLVLRPFEVAVLEVGADLDQFGWSATPSPEVIDSQSLAVEVQEGPSGTVSLAVPAPQHSEGYHQRQAHGRIQLPPIDAPRDLALIVRLASGDAHWYHREINTLMVLQARIGDRTLSYQTTPRHPCFNGPGSPWLLFRLPIAPAHGAGILEFDLTGLLPPEVNWRLEAWLYHAWWRASGAST